MTNLYSTHNIPSKIVVQEVCYQYWPGQIKQNYGEFRVELMSEEVNDGYVMRTFCVQQSKACYDITMLYNLQSWFSVCWHFLSFPSLIRWCNFTSPTGQQMVWALTWGQWSPWLITLPNSREEQATMPLLSMACELHNKRPTLITVAYSYLLGKLYTHAIIYH